ncbi:hypothetical protein NOV72_05009 [Caballeronia novacaledonica]|uniref:Uncharacterized protein n=1 Tax=Caballeronia novacaledonica TaxID=1544861 RepID=A0A2U3IC71_9BURK|nr:hypothetical protein NOV72_05009 [Caballeronia novacaledonica]
MLAENLAMRYRSADRSLHVETHVEGRPRSAGPNPHQIG